MKKKVLAAILAAAAVPVILLAGCGSAGEEQNAQEQQSSSQAESQVESGADSSAVSSEETVKDTLDGTTWKAVSIYYNGQDIDVVDYMNIIHVHGDITLSFKDGKSSLSIPEEPEYEAGYTYVDENHIRIENVTAEFDDTTLHYTSTGLTMTMELQE